MNPLRRESWSPYAVGAGIGALEILAMATAKETLGITSPFEEATRAADETIRAKLRHESPGEDAGVTVSWEWALVAGVLGGSTLSARLSGDRTRRVVPPRWRRRVGPRPIRRLGAAAAGGALMMLGARIAKGCTSGHGISGSMQFDASSWLFNPIMFASGAAVAHTLLGRHS